MLQIDAPTLGAIGSLLAGTAAIGTFLIGVLELLGKFYRRR